jgi:hypothetical protein
MEERQMSSSIRQLIVDESELIFEENPLRRFQSYNDNGIARSAVDGYVMSFDLKF